MNTVSAVNAVDATALVIAKAPIAGFAKTRLTPPFSPKESAQLAAASLLDTLTAVRHSGLRNGVVAWTGTLEDAEYAAELAAELRDFTLIPQRGDSFGERIAHAHNDAGALGLPVLQIGMDTPQAGPALLAACATRLLDRGDAVLGPAVDGGWWALGLTDPGPAAVLAEVAMSTRKTGEHTRDALRRTGCRVHTLPKLSDVDTVDDAIAVAAEYRGRFPRTLARLWARHDAATVAAGARPGLPEPGRGPQRGEVRAEFSARTTFG